MIDTAHETLIPVLAVRQIVPISVPTLRRWTASGQLETVRAGAKVFTSKEAIQRFLQQGPQPSQALALPPTRKQQHRAADVDATMARLRAKLGGF